jgi:predicted metal-dependent peptidase
MPDIYESVSRTIIGLLIDEPFFAHLLGSIPREISDKTETIGLELQTFGPKLLINENYFLKELRTEKKRRGAIKHEALHIAFSHFMRRADQQVHAVFDIAADLVVNQHLKLSEMADDAVTLACFPELRLKPEQTLQYYYDALIAHYVKQEDHQGTGSSEESQASMSENAASGQPGTDQNTDGETSIDSQDDGNLSATSRAIQQLTESQGGGSHEHWGQADQATEYAVENLILRARDRTPVKQWGTIPGGIGQLIDMILQGRKPQVDWKRQLRLFGASSRRTRVVHTIKRVSKRYGTRPGIKIQRFQKLLVAIDTSGSIDMDALELFFGEIRGMWRNGAEITVIECDCEVGRTYPFRGQTPTGLSGGGGTAFDPVFQYVRERRQERFDGIIYLTDGYAARPQVRPPCRVLWVITPDGSDEATAYGPAIHLI